ncbi:MAG: hypothetical protein JWM53_2651, partial [bacterium]|nr:hypothetical protein [bacterium]
MRRLAWIALVVAGCGGSSLTAKDIELDIAVQATISDDEVATVRSLDIAVTGDASSVMTYPLSRALARSERLVVHFPSAQGHVIVSVLARDAQSLIVMRGASGEVHLESGGPHPAMATLALPAAGAHSASGIELVPASFTLFTGQSLQLAAKGETVTWSAMDGGAVDDTGLFAAPATAGIYHAVAQSTLYPTDKASVTLNVLATGIALYAGSLGGLGTVDGVGTAARVNQPQSMLLDGGALYFTDVGQAIRRADIQTGAVTTLAGRPDYALTVDGAGAGAGFVIPAGMVFDGNSTLYVAESACPCIRAVAVGTGQTTTIAGKVGNGGTMDGTGAAAQFRWPQGLAYDAAKHLLYVGEDAAHTIRTVDVTNGTVTTIAGVPDMAGSNDGPANAATFNNPSDFVLDGGVLYIHDRGTSKIRQLDLGTMQVVTLASNVNTSTMTSAGSGKLALALPLRIFDVASKTTTEIRDSDKQQVGDWFNSLVLAPDGTYWGGSVNTLTHYDVAAGKKTRLAGFDYQWQETEGPRTMAGIGSFNSFVVRSDGAVFLRDNRIVRIDSDGKLTSVAGSPSAPVLSGDGGMTFGSDGMLYALDRYSHVIMRIDVDHGGAVTTFAGKASTPGFADGTGVSARLSGPADVTA